MSPSPHLTAQGAMERIHLLGRDREPLASEKRLNGY